MFGHYKIILLSTIFCWKFVFCEINLTEYYQMPNLYRLDDYDKCLGQFTPDQAKLTYCYVDVTIKPEEKSELWKFIEVVSMDKTHYYRHDRLKRGLCLHWCQDIMDDLTVNEQEKYFLTLPTRVVNETTFHPSNFRKGEDFNKKYDKLINFCVNYELKEEYNLMAYTEIEYCQTNEEELVMDKYDILFVLICLAIAGAVLVSSGVDFMFKKSKTGEQRHEFYKTKPANSMNEFLVSFSFLRNWYKLIAPSPADEVKSINAVRFFLSWGIILIHTIVHYTMFSISNTHYIESNYFLVVRMFFVNALILVQSYFTISGFLMAYQFCKHRNKNQDHVDGGYFFRTIINRIIRLVPVYAFVMLLNATWLIYVQDGPVWRHFNEQERKFCRDNWWTNVLFINNYVNSEEPCMIQSWYLGTDFQLFVLSLFALMVIWKFPKSKNWILGGSVMFSIIAPAVVAYVNGFDGIIMVRPESVKYVLWNEKDYNEMYIPAHTNTGSYLAGVIAGWIYFKLRNENIELRLNKFFYGIWVCVMPSALVFLLSGFIFNEFRFEKPAIWIAIYASLAKNLWGIFSAVFIVGMAVGVGWFLKNFFNHRVFRPLGQISYCVFLIHTFILRLTLGNVRQPAIVSDINILMKICSTVALSYMIGFILYVSIELPFSNIQKIIIKEKKRKFADNLAGVSVVDIRHELNNNVK